MPPEILPQRNSITKKNGSNYLLTAPDLQLDWVTDSSSGCSSRGSRSSSYSSSSCDESDDVIYVEPNILPNVPIDLTGDSDEEQINAAPIISTSSATVPNAPVISRSSQSINYRKVNTSTMNRFLNSPTSLQQIHTMRNLINNTIHDHTSNNFNSNNSTSNSTNNNILNNNNSPWYYNRSGTNVRSRNSSIAATIDSNSRSSPIMTANDPIMNDIAIPSTNSMESLPVRVNLSPPPAARENIVPAQLLGSNWNWIS